MLERSAEWLARHNRLPTSARAVFGYYAQAGVFDVGSLRLKRRVDSRIEGYVEDTFGAVEEAIAEEFGYEYVSFDYGTKLLLPANLTLGYLYRHADESVHHKAEQVTRLAVEALLDGDMRDAINDDEYDDFEVDFAADTADRRRVAEIAQEVIQSRVDRQFSTHPEDVRDVYDWAVAISERHQEEDPYFRELMERARDGEAEALAAIRDEYKFAGFEEEPSLFSEGELSLPYLKTQYDRVGVIYDAMIQMYRRSGLEIEDDFHRSIVLAIIGAQLWLDDVDDYPADMADGQLTPVTAEYLLTDDETAAHEQVVNISHEYLDRAERQATAADSTLTGIAAEYIRRDGDPSILPP
ncbi:hypothetical protein [Halovenus salina]|uniref:Uncharacterized protein n=1 Tax=Halovenus salina TaxID=1510225 RepID=A0ABD5W2D5_9EURY|nr:hypothetical protein [Halovenus salina]